MLQKDILDMLINTARLAKETACKKGRRVDLPSAMIAVRGHMPIALVELKRMGRESVGQMAHFMATSFEPDSLGTVFESYAPGTDPSTGEPYQRNPMTGESWGYKNDQRPMMQTLAEDHDGLAKGWVRECLYMCAINRAGDISSALMPYAYVGVKNHLSWGGTVYATPDPTVGAITKWMLSAMDAQTVSQALPEVVAKMSREELDLEMAEALASIGHRCQLIAEAGTNRARFFSH